jgi:hypothetical protein
MDGLWFFDGTEAAKDRLESRKGLLSFDTVWRKGSREYKRVKFVEVSLCKYGYRMNGTFKRGLALEFQDSAEPLFSLMCPTKVACCSLAQGFQLFQGWKIWNPQLLEFLGKIPSDIIVRFLGGKVVAFDMSRDVVNYDSLGPRQDQESHILRKGIGHLSEQGGDSIVWRG